MTSSNVTTAIWRPPASVIVVPETTTVNMPASVSQSTCTWASVSPRAAPIEELLDEDWVDEPEARQLRGVYDYRRRRYAARGGGGRGDPNIEARSEALDRLMREVLAAEREAVLALRDAGHIDDDVMRRIERDLDLEHARLGG